jgi:hypothetical protein
MKIIYIILAALFGLLTIDGLISIIVSLLSFRIGSMVVYGLLTYLFYVITRKCIDSI